MVKGRIPKGISLYFCENTQEILWKFHQIPEVKFGCIPVGINSSGRNWLDFYDRSSVITSDQ